MKKHQYNIWPKASEEDFALIVGDMRKNGFDKSQPITLFGNEVLDGWNRLLASQDAGVTPEFKHFEGTDEEALLYTLRTNKRRNMSSSQRAAYAVEAEELVASIREAVEKERRKKQKANAANQHTKPSDKKLSEPKNEHKDKAATKTAELFNTNRTYVNQASKIRLESPVSFEKVKAGEITILQAMEEIRKEEKKAQREIDIANQKKDIESGKVKLPEGLFEVVSIDPPWAYGRKYDPDGSRVANPYPEMSQEELLKLEPPFADDCVLFLWTTHAFIWDAKELCNHWGFTYKATLVWDKEKIGMGAWLRMQCEFCLVCIKGKPFWNNTTWRDVIREARREHSRKPDQFYTMVESVTAGRRLDYFSREQRQGWETFGNETTKF